MNNLADLYQGQLHQELLVVADAVVEVAAVAQLHGPVEEGERALLSLFAIALGHRGAHLEQG